MKKRKNQNNSSNKVARYPNGKSKKNVFVVCEIPNISKREVIIVCHEKMLIEKSQTELQLSHSPITKVSTEAFHYRLHSALSHLFHIKGHQPKMRKWPVLSFKFPDSKSK